MSVVSTHILAVIEPNKVLHEQAASIVNLAKSLENVPVEAKKSWADLVDEEIDHAQVPSPTIVSDFINESNVEQLIDVIATVWIEAETQSLDITLDLDLVSESCAKLFIKIRKTFPNTPWPLTKAFIFVEHFQPFDLEVQEDLRQLCTTMETFKIFDDNTLTEEQKQQLEKMADLETPDKTKLIRDITILACRKTPSTAVYEKISDDMVVCLDWETRMRYIATLFLALANSYVSTVRTQENILLDCCINLSNEIMRDKERSKFKRSLVQFATLFRIVVRLANSDHLIVSLLRYKQFFDELRDIVLEPNSDKIDIALVLAYLDVIHGLAMNRGKHIVLAKNTNVMDFLFSCLKNENPLVQKGALRAMVPILEGSPLTDFIGKNRCNALIRQLEVHMNKTWLIKSGDLIQVIGLLSKEFNERLKHLNVVAKYAPILSNRYDGKVVQMDLLRCLQTMTVGAVDNPNIIEGITMVHAVPGVFENVIRIVRQAQEGTDVHMAAFRLLAQLIIPNTPIIEKIYQTGVQKDVQKVLLSEQGLHLEAVYFACQLIQCTFEQQRIDELIQDFYGPILERLKTSENVTFVAYALICLSLLARCKDQLNVKQILTCATIKTKNNEIALDIITNPKLLFSPVRDIRCNVFKVISSLSTLPSTANLLVDYGLVPPLVQVAMFDVDACFQNMPCTPQYHAISALNNIVVFNESVKQTLRKTPLFLMTLQQGAVPGSQHPIIRAKNALVANVVRDKSPNGDKWQEVHDNVAKQEKEFLDKNPQFVIKNTVKKEIIMPDDLFSTSKPKGPQCNNPVCPNKDKRDVKIMNCARCAKVGYCSKECQQTMWPIHKNYCKKEEK
jgi:hypothetical protein